jgi:hypothetical protein
MAVRRRLDSAAGRLSGRSCALQLLWLPMIAARQRAPIQPSIRVPQTPRTPEPQVLIGGPALGRGHFPPVALQELGQGASLCDAPIDRDALVDVRLDAARPLLGPRLAIEGLRLRRQAGAADFDSPEFAASLEGRHRTVLLGGVSLDRATGTVPELSQKGSSATIQKATAIQETS